MYYYFFDKIILVIYMDDKDIKIEFINIKNNKVLLNEEKKLPAIYIKESYYSIENIEYYLNLYLNSSISNLKHLKENYYLFELNDELDNYYYYSIEDEDLLFIKEIINEKNIY